MNTYTIAPPKQATQPATPVPVRPPAKRAVTCELVMLEAQRLAQQLARSRAAG